MGRTVQFWVPGLAAPGGSKKAFAHARTGKIVVTDDSGKRGRNWRSCVADQAALAMRGASLCPLSGPLEVCFIFGMPRPKGHYGTGRNANLVKPGAPAHPAVKPDVTKLVRSAEDACTGIVWRDDAQIVMQHAYKAYDTPGLRVTVKELEG